MIFFWHIFQVYNFFQNISAHKFVLSNFEVHILPVFSACLFTRVLVHGLTSRDNDIDNKKQKKKKTFAGIFILLFHICSCYQ